MERTTGNTGWETRRKFAIFLERDKLIHTFASHSKKWDLAYVSTNQNQITVLRSQSGR